MSAHQALYNLIQTLPAADGTLDAYVEQSINNHKTNNITVVMAFPLKVGGTFLRTALIRLLSKNYQSFLMRGSYASTDQARDLYFPSILHQHVSAVEKPMASIAHCHMYATKPVTSLIEGFAIPTIVNTRNIFDTLLSYYDMLEADKWEGIVAKDDFVLQSHTNYHEMSSKDRRWHLVNVAPIWYSRFYAYWIRYSDNCLERGVKQPLWTKFDELKDHPVSLLSKIAKHVDYKHDYSKKEVTAAHRQSIDSKDQLRFNKGVSGRGVKFFNESERETILKLMGQRQTYNRRLEGYGII